MSRLESHIRRLQAQCELLNWATSIQASGYGLALDLGLGNGRTFSHLRERLPGWRIVAFDRQNAADPKSLTKDSEIVVGEFQATLPEFGRQLPNAANIIHSDAGISDPLANARQMALLAATIPLLAADGAIILSDQKIDSPSLAPIRAPVDMKPDRYFVYRHRCAAAGHPLISLAAL